MECRSGNDVLGKDYEFEDYDFTFTCVHKEPGRPIRFRLQTTQGKSNHVDLVPKKIQSDFEHPPPEPSPPNDQAGCDLEGVKPADIMRHIQTDDRYVGCLEGLASKLKAHDSKGKCRVLRLSLETIVASFEKNRPCFKSLEGGWCANARSNAATAARGIYHAAQQCPAL